MVTGTVDDELPEPLPPPPPPPPPLPPLLPLLELEDWATGLTAVILPPTVLPLGISTVTWAPTAASLWELASRSTVTTSRVDVVWSTAVALPPPPPPDEPDESDEFDELDEFDLPELVSPLEPEDFDPE